MPKASNRGPPEALPDLIEFTAPQFYGQEDVGIAKLEVTRQGACAGSSRVSYRTVDGSAHGGKRFVHTSGVLDFKPGEKGKTLEVTLIQDDAFDTTLEFDVCLGDPEGCVLGLYLWKASVLVMDDDAFPTNRFREALLGNNLRHVPRFALMREYYKFNLQDKPLRRVAIMNLICDQFASVKFAWIIFLTNYMFDFIVRPSSGRLPDDHVQKMFLFFAGILIPELITFHLDRMKAKRRLAGKAINRLQANLLRKYMAYDDASRHNVSTSDLVMAITRDVPDLVHVGFLNGFAMAEQVGLLVGLVFLNVFQNATHRPVQTVLMTVSFPLILVTFFYLRHKGSLRRRRAVFSAQAKLVAYVKQTTDNFRVIADYFQVSASIETFTHKVCDLNDRNTDEAVWSCVNQNFTPTLTAIFLLVYVGTNYQDAAETGSLPIGQFITGIGMWSSMGKCYQQLYQGMLKLQQAISPLENISFYMNLPVDTSLRMRSARRLADMNRQEYCEIHSWYADGLVESDTPGFKAHGVRLEVATRVKAQSSTENSIIAQELKHRNTAKPVDRWSSPLYPGDLLCMYGRNISFSYPTSSRYVLQDCDFTFSQGKLVVVTGDRGGGKATFLNLLSGILTPLQTEETKFFIPSHCRVLHVGIDATVIPHLNLFDNLCFGPSDGDDEQADRVLSICRRLGMSDRVLANLEEEASGDQKAKASEKSAADEVVVEEAEDAEGPSGTVESVVARAAMDQIREEEGLLSQTDKCLIHIARALVMNPEIMILHKPLAHFDDFHGKVVLDLLREFVDHRGVHENPSTLSFRRPRTCIFSVSSTRGVEMADVVLHVSAGMVEPVDGDELQLSQNLGRELFTDLDPTGDHRPSFADFCSNCRTAKWSRELLGIDSTTDMEVVRERFGQIAGDAPFMEFRMLLRHLRKTKPDLSSAMYHKASSFINANPEALLEDEKPPNAKPANPSVAILLNQNQQDVAFDIRLREKLPSSSWSHQKGNALPAALEVHPRRNVEGALQSGPAACVAAVPPSLPPLTHILQETQPTQVVQQPKYAHCQLFC